VGIRDLVVTSNDGARVLLHGVSLFLNAGDRVALLGGSGAGKTLLASAMIGALHNRRLKIKGDVFIKGVNIKKIKPQDISKMRQHTVRMLMQDPIAALNPTQSAGQHIVESLRFVLPREHQAVLEERARQLLAEVGFQDPDRIFVQYPHQLSGGECQRVCIAAAISCKPALLIADEPCSSLDPVTTKHIMELLCRLSKAHQMALLLISHNVHDIYYVEHLYVMRDGHIVDSLPCKNVYMRAQPYTKRLFDMSASSLCPPVARGVEPIMTAKNLYTEYVSGRWFNTKKHVGIKDVSCTIYPSHVLGVCGASGSGKTTLAYRLAHVLHGRGDLTLFGKPITSGLESQDRQYFRHTVQMILQSAPNSLNPYKTVYDILTEAARYYNLYHQHELYDKVQDALGWVRLSPAILDTDIQRLSGGECQRIVLARTLLLKPRVLILDEPTSALDFLAKDRILTILERLRDEMEMAIVLISHDIQVMRRMANYVLLLHEGQVAEEGNSDRFFNHPHTDTLKDFLGVHHDVA